MVSKSEERVMGIDAVKPNVSVVIPVYNNQATIERLSLELLNTLKRLNKSCELILVNDASVDDSWQIISELSKKYELVRGVSFSKNRGQNIAIFAGLKKTKADVILTMDADLQDDPEMVPELIKALDEHTDIVFIKRIGKYQGGKRMLTSLLFKGFLQLITGLHRKAGSYYLVRRDVVEKMINFKSRYPIMTVMAYSLSKHIKYIPAQRANNEGISSYTFWRRCHYAFRATCCAIQCRIYRLRS